MVSNGTSFGGAIAANGSRGKRKGGSGIRMVDGKVRARNGITAEELNQEQLEEAKNMLLKEKQAQLERVYDHHDTLVREIFHMLHFRTMTAYDPLEAKKDDTAVFREYKAGFDLLGTSEASSSDSPRKRTRSSQAERTHSILQLSVSTPVLKEKHQKAGKVDAAAIRDILTSSAKHKSKGKEKAVDPPIEVEESISSRTTFRKKTLRDTVSGDHTKSPPKIHRNVAESPRKRRKLEVDSDLVSSNNTHDPGGSLSTSQDKLPVNLDLSIRPVSRSKSRRTDTAEPSNVELDDPYPNYLPTTSPDIPEYIPPPSPSKPLHHIKRIKLIVRKPPPLLTNPRQRAPPPKFNNSLERFLSSFSYHSDEGISIDQLNSRIHNDADLLEKADKIRREGRFFGEVAALELDDDSSDPLKKGTQGKQSKDAWDHCIEDVMLYNDARKQQPSGQTIAAQVAAKIRAYWEAQSVRQEKTKAQEEKRLRALAKMTIKMVTSEWKKAVFHIREQERLRLEAEEVRRGHEHLDAILNQSGQILETQQVDLLRGDISRSISRSRSVSVFDAGDSDDESGTEDQVSEDEGEGNDDEDSASSDTDEERDGSHAGDESAIDIDLSEIYGNDIERQGPLHPPDGFGTPHLRPSPTPAFLSPEPDSLDSHRQERPKTPMDDKPHSPPNALEALTCYPDSDFEPTDASDNSVIHASNIDFVPLGSHSSSSDGVITPPLQPLADNVRHLDGVHTDDSFTEVITLPDKADGMSAYDPQAKDVSRPGMPIGEGPVTAPAEDPSEDQLGRTPEEGTTVQIPREQTPDEDEGEEVADDGIPEYLKPFAVAPVEYDSSQKMTQPLLLRGVLRPYQFSGLEWLASLHTNNLNGILADEMGLGKTIQTISLLAHLACDRGIWGPHLIIVPTSVLLNWEMEFKKFLPGFKILSYHGNTKRRKELRQGWNDKHHFNVCITSYTLASRDAHIFKRKAWYYMILDEAHMIKNFKSQRWNILLMFRSFRRLLLTGTPLQNNLTELWALLQFLMSGANFANLKEFGEWFSNPLEKAIEMGNVLDNETMQRVTKLHTVLRPYLLRRLKRDVEKELPSKYEHLVLCPLSKRQRYLYDEFMTRAPTQDALQSGIYQKIANILMQLRKVCNHPDLFELRPIVTSFSMERSAIADFEIKELLIRRRLLTEQDSLDLETPGFRFVDHQQRSELAAEETRRLDASAQFPFIHEMPGDPPPKDLRTVKGYRTYSAWQRHAEEIADWKHLSYLNHLRCSRIPILSSEKFRMVRQFSQPLLPLANLDTRSDYMNTVFPLHKAILSFTERAEDMAVLIDRFAFVTPTAFARDLPRIALPGAEELLRGQPLDFDQLLHRAAVKLQIGFPDPSLLQYDCGKLQKLAELLREKKAGGHRVLIFTQMTRILDILEIFLNLHGYLYLRLDGATKIEDRQYITERFNVDQKIFCFISSSRSGGVGINLTGADTVVFYDSDFNPQMDRQCEDRAHRIGQIRDVHIYRFVSQHTVEEAMLRKANQKRSLDDIVIQKGEFDWRSLFDNENALTKALVEFEDTEDALAAEVAAREADVMEGADNDDFGGGEGVAEHEHENRGRGVPANDPRDEDLRDVDELLDPDDGEDEEGGSVVEYMLGFVKRDMEFFQDWRL